MGYQTDINDLQYDLKCWTEKQFPQRTTSSICAHLRKEAAEVEAQPKDVMEYADCMLLLLDAASYNGIHASDILRACYDKIAINKARKWGEPNSDGFVEHLKDDKKIKYIMHVQGPDDVVEFDSEQEAVNEANRINASHAIAMQSKTEEEKKYYPNVFAFVLREDFYSEYFC